MFESCRAHLRTPAPRLEFGVVRDLDTHVAQGDAVDGARHPSHRLVAEADLVPGRSRLDLEDTEAAVDLAAVAEPRDRLLARIAALREADCRLVQAGLGGEHPVVQIPAPPGRPG